VKVSIEHEIKVKQKKRRSDIQRKVIL